MRIWKKSLSFVQKGWKNVNGTVQYCFFPRHSLFTVDRGQYITMLAYLGIF